MPRWMIQFFGMARSYRAGFLPVAGGHLEQPAIVFDAVRALVIEQDEISAVKAKIARKRT